MAFLDVPYNVRVSSIGGRGGVKHAEFAFASGEMSRPEYVEFLVGALGNASRVSRDGAVHYVCSDWRHVTEIVEAGGRSYGETLNIVVWVKSNAGQGSFYRSQHEFVVVFRVGETPHLNNIDLGRHGRSRSNVWNYRGVNTFGAGRMEELRSHPTVKPVALVADAMRDCTRRRDVVLDTFSGSGTTIMAGRCRRSSLAVFHRERRPGYRERQNIRSARGARRPRSQRASCQPGRSERNQRGSKADRRRTRPRSRPDICEHIAATVIYTPDRGC
jgi:hypothetical protein